MTNNRKLIIHIGSHKTGTSSIQHTLFQNRATLRKQGFTLFNQDPNGKERKSGNAITWIKFRLNRKHRIEGRIRKKLPAALGTINGNVIISAETFSWVFDGREIDRFKTNLSAYFDDIEIIAYIRRQDLQTVSHYQQASKYGAFVAARFYGGESRALPSYKKHFQKYLNYHHRLGLWADAFGEKNLCMRIFEPDRLQNGDAVDDFFDAVGLIVETTPVRKNESSGYQKTKVGHLISQQEFSLPVWRALIKHLDNTGILLPSRDEATNYYAHFKANNELLNRRFSLTNEPNLFNSNFNMYPATANDRWTESSANSAIQNLLRGVKSHSPFDKGEIEFLKKCAEKLKVGDVKSSRKLLSILEKYSPETEFFVHAKTSVKSRIKAYLRK
ncbi:MAG: hypothetical protein DRR42_08015 [Gammaproteobacteria bacterium]|nr:MAG: hypothetical protein DRR42_08015 [Gammaproteobacteria bacterium]